MTLGSVNQLDELLDPVESIAIIPNSSSFFNELYIIVQRENGRFIERLALRNEAVDCGGDRTILTEDQVFLDSALSYDTGVDIDDITDNGDGTALVEIEDHGFSSGDIVVLSCAESFNGRYTVSNYEPVINYWPVSGTVNSPAWSPVGQNASESLVKQACYNCTITKMVIRLATAPGSGKTRRFTIRKNGADTDLKITFSDSDTTGSVSESVSFGSTYFDHISLKEELLSGATESAFSLSLLAEAATDRQVIVTGRRFTTNYIQAGCSFPIMNDPAVNMDQSIGKTTPQLLSRFSSLISSDGTLKNYRQLLDAAPNPGDPTKWMTFEVNVYTETMTGGATSLDFLIAGSDTTGDSAAKTKAVTAGQMALFFVNTNSGPTTQFPGSEAIDFIPTTAGARIYSCPLNIPVSTTRYSSGVGTSINGDQSTVEQYIVCPTSGTIKNLYVNLLNLTPGAGKTLTVTVRKNSVDTALTLSIVDANKFGSNTSNSFTVVAGDLVSIKGTTDSGNLNASSTGPKIGWTFIADNPLESPIFLSSWAEDVTTNSPTVSTNQFLITLNAQAVQTYQGGGIAHLGANSFSGLEHLEDETVGILADGVPLDQEVVSDGSITLDQEYGTVIVGLPINADIETSSLEVR